MNQDYYELKIVNSESLNYCFVLKKNRIVIGHADTCDIVLPHDDISPIHCVIETHGNEFQIYDMNSKHGTYLNDKKIVSYVLLAVIFTFLVLETILLSRLMNVNAFDQPAVELVKIKTKKFLA